MSQAKSFYDRPLVEFAALERLGEGKMNVVAGHRRFELKVGMDGVLLYEGGQLVGKSGWDALMGFMAHQQRRMDSLIGDRHVPRSLMAHPDFETGIMPYLYVNEYQGDRLARGSTRRRVEVRVPTVAEADRLMGIEIACANPDCLHTIHPFRPRAKGNPLRLFVGFTCPIEESIACARTRGAKEAMEIVVERVESAGQISSNDVRR
jgi:hypothetical protein